MMRSHSRSSYPLDKLLPLNASKDSYEHRDEPNQVHINGTYVYVVCHGRWSSDVPKKLHKKKQRQYNRKLERDEQ